MEKVQAAADPTDASRQSGDDVAFSRVPAERLAKKHRELAYPYRCTFGGALLEIDRGVFCPTLTRASPLLLDAVRFNQAERVLDAFSGSGAFGVIAALRGAQDVISVDLSHAATACAAKNARRNGVNAVMSVRTGTMQSCIESDELFDLILANPPLLPGSHSDSLSMAMFDPGLRATVDFIRSLPRHLTARGRGYFLTSDVMERCGYDVDRLCFESGLFPSTVAKLDAGYECYRVHMVELDLH